MQSWQPCGMLLARTLEFFWSKWVNVERITVFYDLSSSKNFAGVVGSNFANVADEYLPMTGKYPLQFSSKLKYFFLKLKIFQIFLWTNKIPYYLPGCFFLNVRQLFNDSRVTSMNINILKRQFSSNLATGLVESHSYSSDKYLLPEI